MYNKISRQKSRWKQHHTVAVGNKRERREEGKRVDDRAVAENKVSIEIRRKQKDKVTDENKLTEEQNTFRVMV